MDNAMEDWISYAHQNFSAKLKYPNPTLQGSLVSINEITGNESFRAHFVSEGSDEVYLEIGQYSNLPVEQAIDDFLKDVSARIEGLEKSEIETLTFANYLAHRFSIRWPGKERVILFIEMDDSLYRIIHDPTSMINKQILESIEFR